MRLSSNLLNITLMLLIGSVSPDCWTIWINTSQNPITRPCSTVASGPVISLQGQTGEHAAYSHAEWGAQDDSDSQNSNVTAMLAEGNNANFVTFTEGTTLAEGQTASSGAGEHMTSFDYAYKLEAVRDWLFEQSK